MGVCFLYVGTGYIFDGESGMYREKDWADPICAYGLTKLRGESR